MVRFEILGPLRAVRSDGTAVSFAGLQGLLLASLLAQTNQRVTTDRLVDILWGSDPENRAAHRLQTHVYRLRQTLGGCAEISAEAGGYRLAVSSEALDSAEFESLVQRARQLGTRDPQGAVHHLRDALGLWRGEAFDGFDTPETRSRARKLDDLKLLALEQLFSAELECGNHDTVSNELLPILEEHPLREKLHELLIISYALDSRQTDALSAYQRARSVFVDELGIEPGPRLRELEMQILKGDRPETKPAPPNAIPIPAQLPAPPGGFMGREDEFRQLSTLAAGTGTATKIGVVTGGGGVGKTALVLHWAHHHREEFPDGQLFTNLRGYGSEAPAQTTGVLAAFLRALGVDSDRIPDDVEERAALFRSQTADRKMLIVLDNARDVQQVRPLLPSTASCSVVVTSRTPLTGLVVQEGAHEVVLPRMTRDTASALVAELVDDSHDPDAIARLTELCAYLPLALRIAAERVRAVKVDDIDAVVAELADERSRLDILDAGDEHSSVRGVFSWSYQKLGDSTAWLFRCFGMSPVRTLNAATLAAVSALDASSVRRGLEELRRAHLIEPAGHNCFHTHDLLRSFAVEMAGAGQEHETGETLSRLCDYYLKTTATALEQIMPEEMARSVGREILDDENLDRPFANSDEAELWLETERENLILAAERAAREDHHSYPVTLSHLLGRYLDTRALHDEAARVHSSALTAARIADSAWDEGETLRRLGLVEMRNDRFEHAIEQLHAAREIHEHAGESLQVAHVNIVLGGAYLYAGRVPEARDHCEKAITTFDDHGDSGADFAMSNYGLLHYTLGHPKEALRWLVPSLRVSQEHGKRLNECAALRNLTAVYGELGDYNRALDCAERGLQLAEELGRDTDRAKILNSVGSVHRRRHELETARHHHLQALAIGNPLEDRDITVVAHNGLADTARASGDLATARYHHLTALHLSRNLWELCSSALIGLGETADQRGDDAEAVAYWQEALDLYEKVGHAHAPVLRKKIEAAGSGSIS